MHTALFIGITASCLSAALPADLQFIKVDGLPHSRIRRVSIARNNPDFMAVAAENILYLSTDGGGTFSTAAVLKGERINDLFIDEDDSTTVYLAGSRNAYRSADRTENIFTAREGEEINAIARHGNALFIGTSQGLYTAEKERPTWKPVAGIRNSPVHSLQPHGSALFICSDAGVHRYRTDGTLARLFVTRSPEGSDGLKAYQVKVDAMTPSRLWLCTSKGVYSSSDRGETWQRLQIDGAGTPEAYCLAQFPLDGNHVYLCCSAGLLKVEAESGASRSLFHGLPTANLHWIDISPSGTLYLATDQGLFRQTDQAPPRTRMGVAAILQNEPGIHEVQEAAMRYNSVHPGKTENWKRRLKYRALFPRVGMDYDKTIGSSFTSSGYYYARGPYDWGVSLTWDLGNLIWNSYEDDIDNRTKLTTQLRLDILDEINRLYFERLRLKHELAQAVTGVDDTTLLELRLHELTATLDGYTGGLFSQ